LRNKRGREGNNYDTEDAKSHGLEKNTTNKKKSILDDALVILKHTKRGGKLTLKAE